MTLSLTWHRQRIAVILRGLMQENRIPPGRPRGATTFDPVIAQAFGAAVRELRLVRGIAQEALAGKAGIERSHMGKIERGEHLPTLAAILKLAGALGCRASELIATMEQKLPPARTPAADKT